MIKLYDVVRIKDSGITGIVTNISSAKGRTVYTVENNKRGRTGIPGARNDDASHLYLPRNAQRYVVRMFALGYWVPVRRP